MACSRPTRPCSPRSWPARPTNHQWGRRALLGLNTDSHELGAITQTRHRHRHHHLSTMWRPLNHPRCDRGPCGDHQDFEPPGLANPRSTTSPGPAQRVPTNGLSSPRIPVQCRSRHSPFAQFPHSHTTMERQADPILEKWALPPHLAWELPPFRR